MPSSFCAGAYPDCADWPNHRQACEASGLMPTSPSRYAMPRRYWAGASPASAAARMGARSAVCASQTGVRPAAKNPAKHAIRNRRPVKPVPNPSPHCRFRARSFVFTRQKEIPMTTRPLVIAAVLLACATTYANVSPADQQASEAAFARLKTLVGRWQSQGDGKNALTYELIAGGTALLERDFSPDRPDMVTLYHLDGNRLLLTHYCMAGNQPRMQLRAFDAATGEAKFELVDATNLPNPAAGHMHSVAFRFLSADEIVTEWQFYENGRAKMTEKTKFARVR